MAAEKLTASRSALDFNHGIPRRLAPLLGGPADSARIFTLLIFRDLGCARELNL
jgi:hypothetical protein